MVGISIRALSAVLAGAALSVAYNAAALELIWYVHAGDRSFLTRILFAPGLLLAPRGFEGQAAVIPFNAVSLFVVFAGSAWLILTRRTRCTAKHSVVAR